MKTGLALEVRDRMILSTGDKIDYIVSSEARQLCLDRVWHPLIDQFHNGMIVSSIRNLNRIQYDKREK